MYNWLGACRVSRRAGRLSRYGRVYLVVEDEHESEDTMQIGRGVVVLLALEQRNEHIVLPVIIQPFLLQVDIKHFYDVFRSERS
jgi:hypothetical protein